MKRIGLVCIAIVSVFLFSSVASATNWVLVLRDDSTFKSKSNVYVDADSVVRNGDTISFWRATVLDEAESGSHNRKRILQKLEAKLTDPPQVRTVETYWYDTTGTEVFAIPDAYDSGFVTPHENSVNARSIPFAARYAKPGKLGKDNTPKPTP